MTSQALNRPVDVLAQEIRRVDGNHSLGAGALAEALMPFVEREFVARAAVAELIEALADCVTDMQQTEEFYGTHPRAREVIVRAKAALAAIGSQP